VLILDLIPHGMVRLQVKPQPLYGLNLMTIPDSDTKLLWGRAAGICSNPDCRTDLTVVLTEGDSFNVGEMAHVIARQPGGARGIHGGGSNTYDNLILLCPTCHRRVDKAPVGIYTTEKLHQWKAQHEENVRKLGSELKFASTQALKDYVTRLLLENRNIWQQLGPHSDTANSDPGSNLYLVWNYRKLDTIVPNNRKIMNAVVANQSLLSLDEYEVFVSFKTHALAFEAHQFARTDAYPLFPIAFAEVFRP
jgi:hypothetical protein